jgi:hypothetical protein
MRVFEPVGQEGYELAQPTDPRDFELMNSMIDGRTRRHGWRPVKAVLIRFDETGRARAESDAPWLGSHALVMKQAAFDAMEPLIGTHSERLDLDCDEARLVVVNPIHLVDALDEPRSEVDRLEPSGRVWRVGRYEFRPERIQSLPIFKITSLRVSPTFVSEAFVARWIGAGLQGLRFEQVWGL